MKRRGVASTFGVSAACTAIACGAMSGCGSASFRLGDEPGNEDSGSTTLDASPKDDGGTVAPPGDSGLLPDGAPIPDTCTTIGATRTCTDKTHIQTCMPLGDAGAWSRCVPTTCEGSSPLPAGAQAACIAAGSFTMGGLASSGNGAGENDTLPAHPVTLAHRFYLDQFEVSVGELNTWWNNGAPIKPAIGQVVFVSGSGEVWRWSAADDAAVSAPGDGLNCTTNSNKPLASINCVSRATALAYCVSVGGRLPTEAEWEFAASGQGKGNVFPWGANAPTTIEEKSCLLTIDSACVAGPSGAQFPFPRPSATDGNTNATLGSLNNLAGNVAEWTLDFAPAQGAGCASGACWPNGGNDPWASTDSGQAVVRGGSFQSAADQVRTRARAFVSPTAPQVPATIGFRCLHTD